jgi:hypothetical protein
MKRRLWQVVGVAVVAVGAMGLAGCGGGSGDPPSSTGFAGALTVLGYNDLGMHCLNQDFSQIMILPPFNNLHAQVIDRTARTPQLVTSGITVSYTIPGNTISSTKTNFWDFVSPLFGVSLTPDIGFLGKGLTGTLDATATNDWAAMGIPLTPQTDAGIFNPYQLAVVTVKRGSDTVARTRAVVPCNWQINCDLCHVPSPGVTVADNILSAHDRLHATTLMQQQPVACGTCHVQPELVPLGIVSDDPNNPTLSRAIHHAHASRMAQAQLSNECYACHPSAQMPCLRDVHAAKGFVCRDCHGDMLAVADVTRRPWQDEPRCSNCHHAHEYEQPDTLYRDSKGHGGVHCEACHGSPHAITPSLIPADNQQALDLQGHTGVINKCTLCHSDGVQQAQFTHVWNGK